MCSPLEMPPCTPPDLGCCEEGEKGGVGYACMQRGR
jgi:hypothetical protein